MEKAGLIAWTRRLPLEIIQNTVSTWMTMPAAFQKKFAGTLIGSYTTIDLRVLKLTVSSVLECLWKERAENADTLLTCS